MSFSPRRGELLTGCTGVVTSVPAAFFARICALIFAAAAAAAAAAADAGPPPEGLSVERASGLRLRRAEASSFVDGERDLRSKRDFRVSEGAGSVWSNLERLRDASAIFWMIT